MACPGIYGTGMGIRGWGVKGGKGIGGGAVCCWNWRGGFWGGGRVGCWRDPGGTMGPCTCPGGSIWGGCIGGIGPMGGKGTGSSAIVFYLIIKQNIVYQFVYSIKTVYRN